jgi:hypothetical protein
MILQLVMFGGGYNGSLSKTVFVERMVPTPLFYTNHNVGEMADIYEEEPDDEIWICG